MKECLYCKNKIIDNTSNKTKKFCSNVCSNYYRQLKKEQQCLDCNIKFYKPIKRKYCDACKNKSLHHKPIKKLCSFCGFIIYDTTRAHKKKFCSETCSNSYRQKNKKQICTDCGKIFNHHVKRLYCDTCVYKSRKKLKKKCLWCGNNLINKNYCNKDCHYHYNRQKYIDKAKNWKKLNPEKVAKINSSWKFRMYHQDPLYKINCNLRNHLRTTLKRYTKTGKIYSTKDYGISLKKIIKKFETKAGFSFIDNPKKALEYIKNREIDHKIPIHQVLVKKDYNGDSDELMNKIKILYSANNLQLIKSEVHKEKSAKEFSKHQKITRLIKKDVKLEVREVIKEDAKIIINFFHYSDVMPRLTKYYLGYFLDDVLVGIMTLGWGVQPDKTISKLFPSMKKENYLEIGKLCLDERLPKNSGSKFISLCFKYIKNKNKNIKIIFSWADGLLGKPGFIYQASNFSYGGSIWSKRYFTDNGYKIHPRSSKYLCEDNAKKENYNKLTWLTDSYMKSKNIKLYQGLQFRYCYFLCDKIEKKRLLKNSHYNWNLAYPKYEDLTWKVKKDKRYIKSEKPKYFESLSSQETLRLIV